MTIAEQQFFELLRAGLWGRNADAGMFKGQVDWKQVLHAASSQTVLIIVADGIETLPKELWPSKDTMLKLMMMRIKTRQMHQLLNSTLNEITTALTAEGIPSILLKGQGVAQNYIRPESRSCGDIDLYVGMENFMEACRVVGKISSTPVEEGIDSPHHMHMKMNGVEIEVHKKADYMPSERSDRSLQEWTAELLDDNFRSGNLPHWDNDGTSISLAPETFDAFFIFHHMVRHMTTAGVGMRQLCDWSMYLHRHHDKVDTAVLQAKLKEYKLEQVWNEFGKLAVVHLGLPASSLPLCPEVLESGKTEKIIRQIMISGNFGHHDTVNKLHKSVKEQGYMKKKWRDFRFQSSRLIRLLSIFPEYIISYAWGWITGGISRVSNHQ